MNQSAPASHSPPNPKKIPFELAAVFIAAPYVFLRLAGDDYSQGSSLTLVDVLLIFAGLKALLSTLKFNSATSYPILFIGGAFVTWSMVSILQGLFLYDIGDRFSMVTFLSGVSQYAFVMLFLPILASFYLTPQNLRSALRWISIGYLFPMFLTLLFLPHSTPDRIREIFFFGNRALGAYGNANTFGGLLVMTFPYYILLSVAEKGFWRAIGYIGVSMSLFCIFLSVTFSAAISLGALILINLFLPLVWRGHPVYKYKARFAQLVMSTLICLTVVGVIVTTVFPFILEDVSKRLFFLDASNTKSVEVENLGSGDQRLKLIELGLELIDKRDGGFLSGHGLRQTEAMREFSFSGDHQEVHLIYLLLWIEGGLVLLGIFCAFLFMLFKNIFCLAKIAPFEAVAIASAIIGLALFGLFYPHMYMRFFWMPLLPAFVNWGAYLPATRTSTSPVPTETTLLPQ